MSEFITGKDLEDTIYNTIWETERKLLIVSPFIKLENGGGDYVISVNKTDEGARTFVIDYHCESADKSHVGTDIDVTQFGLP